MCGAVERVLDSLRARGGNPRANGQGFTDRCPAHDDQHASLSVGTGDDGRALLHCHAGCTNEQVVAGVGLTMADLFERGDGHKHRRQVAEYNYTDESGNLLFQVVRFDPKDFRQRRPDADGAWIWGLTAGLYEQRNGSPDWTKVKGSAGKDKRPHEKARWIEAGRRVLYHLPKVIATVCDGGTIYVTEGEDDADAINALPDAGNLIATCNPGGAGKWRPEFSETFRGAPVVIVQDKDGPEIKHAGQKHAREVADSLRGVAASVRIVEAKEGKDAHDHLAAGFTLADFIAVDELTELGEGPALGDSADFGGSPREEPGVDADPIPLSDVVKVFQKWLYLPDPASLYAILAAIAANRMPGDPIWLLIVGGSSWGKSEQLGAAVNLPDVFPAATITEAALLSGTANRDKAKAAKGGLLRTIGNYGIILCKDFGSILNMNRDARASVLAALREVYDGSWTRHVGTDGGKTLHWTGKVGFLGGCTHTIDRHHAVMSVMGERFIFFRIQEKEGDDVKLAGRALDHAGREAVMRREMSEAVTRFLAGLPLDTATPEIDPEERKRLINLASFIVRCRSAVERDGYSREIELITGAEAPGRLSVILSKLLAALDRIGLVRAEAWRVIKKMALDSIPGLRRRILEILARVDGEMTIAAVALKAQYPTNTTRRQLEELAAYGVVTHVGQGQGRTDSWQLTLWARTKLEATFPEMLGTIRDGQEDLKEDAGALIIPTRVQTDFSGKVLPCEPRDGEDACSIGALEPLGPDDTFEIAAPTVPR